MNIRNLAAAALLASLGLTAGAQTMKPGLWEVSNKMQSGSGQMEQAMAQAKQERANMPPAQRKAMEQMMAKQGVKIGAGGMSARVCMTQEMVERNELPAQQGNCKTTSQQRTGNTMKFAFSCTDPASSGEGQVVFVSPEAYTMTMAVTAPMQAGAAEKISVDGSGKWLTADCGAVKPLGSAASK